MVVNEVAKKSRKNYLWPIHHLTDVTKLKIGQIKININ